MKDPTEKQVQFASTIARTLGIELPAEKTRQSLFLFIRDNKPRFLEKQSMDRHNARVADVARFDDDDDPEPIDDADYWSGYDMCGLDPYTGGFEDNY